MHRPAGGDTYATAAAPLSHSVQRAVCLPDHMQCFVFGRRSFACSLSVLYLLAYAMRRHPAPLGGGSGIATTATPASLWYFATPGHSRGRHRAAPRQLRFTVIPILRRLTPAAYSSRCNIQIAFDIEHCAAVALA